MKNTRFEIIKNAVTDIDGNFYDGIKINGKLWMASNLRTTRFNDGTSIKRFASSDGGKKPYFEYPNVDKSNLNDYGLYYNFEAVNTGLLAPKGWHVPSKGEWEGLFAFIAQQPDYNLDMYDKGAFGSHIAKSLCSKTGWDSDTKIDAVGNNQALNNATGFNIFPSGYWNPMSSAGYRVGNLTHFWSIAPHFSTADNAWFVYTSYDYADMLQDAISRFYGFSVRCVCNEQ